jgi:AcrR family transcriptional regulator
MAKTPTAAVPPIHPEASLRDRLLDAAEELYGQSGVDGVSLRQIGAHAGSGNNSAVQSCFNDVDGLVAAILTKRGAEVETLRGRMLARLEPHQLDVGSYTAVLIRPVIDHRNDKGERAFARFFLALSSSPRALRHLPKTPLNLPIAEAILEKLYAACPDFPPALVRERLRLATTMALTSIFNRVAPYDTDDLDEVLVANALTMANAAVLAPLPPEIAMTLLDRAALKPPGR